ncbi:MAG: PaaI family thioesterase [Candidatus Eisenbacteria bacterium]|nr:PaaI family thioesterase [Candidatus Eisenbacteria bacterium]
MGTDDGMCFACGTRNSRGLGLRFDFDGGEAAADVVFDEAFQGYEGIVHGGIVSTVLDEAMVTVLNEMGELALTAELVVRFVSPARVGEPLRVTGRLVAGRGKLRKLEALLARPDGTEVARARSTYVRIGRLRTKPAQGAPDPAGRMP